MRRDPIIVQGMLGMGDNIYQRPILRAMQRLYGPIELITAWPQFFTDLGIKQYPWHSGIRTCQKNVLRSRFDGNPQSALLQLRYDPPHLHAGVTVYASMERLTGVRLKSICPDMPDYGAPPLPPDFGDYILTRPATTRDDWISFSRNPKAEYVAQACDWAREDGFKIVIVGDLDPPHETALEPMPRADQAWLSGELTAEQLMALTAGAKGIIAPIGWVVPASLAYQVPLLAIVGGQLANNHPNVLTDTRLLWNKITWAMPDQPCMCGDVTHDCYRSIANLRGFYDEFLATVRAT